MHPTGPPRRRQVLAMGLGAWALPHVAAQAAAFVHPVDEPAGLTELAPRSALLAIARTGDRLVAAGLRGIVAHSDDGGRTWRQAAVPVRVDLVALSFPRERDGWAVGHEGVLLATRDGGETWTRRLAGRQAVELALSYYRARPTPDAGESRALRAAERQWREGGAPAFLDVHFDSETTGFIAGAFNTLWRTADAGASWVPWMDRIGNPQELHLNAARGRAGRVYLVGEQGTVWRLDADTERFTALPAAFGGTLFGLLAQPSGGLLVFGMRGTVHRSEDGGASWHRVPLPTQAGITAGTTLPDGSLVLADQSGGLHCSEDGGRSFRAPLRTAAPIFGVAAAGPGAVVACGARGVARIALG